MVYIVVSLIAYLLGSISFSIILGKKFSGKDIRAEGSKNAGSTNVLRVAGKKAAILTLLGDVLKGVVAVLVAYVVANIYPEENGALMVQLAAGFSIIGHMFPIFYKFKGGKGVATSLGIIFILNYQIGLICLIFALILIFLTKMVSVGSIASAILFPVLTLFNITDGYLIEGHYLIFAIIIAIIIVYNHRTNLQRLMNGTENKISFKSQKEAK